MPFHQQRRVGGALGRSIRAIRRRLDLNQGEMAARLGWPRNMVTQYELHTARPRVGRLFDLLGLAVGEEEAAPIIAALEAQGIRAADLSAIAFTLRAHGAQQSPEVNP